MVFIRKIKDLFGCKEFIKNLEKENMVKKLKIFICAFLLASLPTISYAICPYDQNCLNNPYGAGSRYKSDGLMNPNSRYGSKYSNDSWTNPHATNAPKIYDQNGNYRGKLSSNRYDPDSTSNPYGRYGSKYSADSVNNPYGAGNPYSNDELYVEGQ